MFLMSFDNWHQTIFPKIQLTFINKIRQRKLLSSRKVSFLPARFSAKADSRSKTPNSVALRVSISLISENHFHYIRIFDTRDHLDMPLAQFAVFNIYFKHVAGHSMFKLDSFGVRYVNCVKTSWFYSFLQIH